MAENTEDSHQQAEGQQENGTQANESGQSNTSQGFPANTPWQDMTPGEQVNYWKHQSRRHEQRANNIGATADEVQQLRQRAQVADQLERKNMDDHQREVAETRDSVRAELEAAFRPQLAETAFRVAIGDRKQPAEIDDFINGTNLTHFLTADGHVDTDKVLARVQEFAPATGTTGTTQQQRGPSSAGQGARRSTTSTASVAAGRELWNARNPSRAVGA